MKCGVNDGVEVWNMGAMKDKWLRGTMTPNAQKLN